LCVCVCARARMCVHTGLHNLSKSVNFMQTRHKISHTFMYSRQAH